MTEAQILARQMNKARELSLWYLSFLKEVDTLKTFDFEGKVFNSVIWEVGHLTVTESFLTLYLTYGESPKIAWAKQFGLGSSNRPNEEFPNFSEVWNTFKSIHRQAIQHIESLTAEQLDLPTKAAFNLAGVETVRDAIVHAIRHESVHTGHLGWLCKLHGIKTI